MSDRARLRELLRQAPAIDRHFACGGPKASVERVAERFLDDLTDYLLSVGYCVNATRALEAAGEPEELGGG